MSNYQNDREIGSTVGEDAEDQPVEETPGGVDPDVTTPREDQEFSEPDGIGEDDEDETEDESAPADQSSQGGTVTGPDVEPR